MTTPTTIADLLPLRASAGAVRNHIVIAATGKPICEVFHHPVGTNLAKQMQARIVLAVNKHDVLVAVLDQARAALDQCQHVKGVTEQAISAIDAALAGVQ